MQRNNILFKVDCDSGEYAGTGHLSRMLLIYNFIKKKYKSQYKHYFLIRNLKNSKKILRNKVSEKIFIYDSNFKKNLSFLCDRDIIINDTPNGIDKFFFDFCEGKKIKNIISFDDLGNYSQENFTVINGIAFFKKKIISKKNNKIFQGPEYILLNQQFLQKRKVKRNRNSLKVLVCSGGADYKNILYKISKFLSYFHNIKIYVVIGSAVKNNNPIRKLNKKNIYFIKNKNNLKKYFDTADFSIVTGGITMFESLATNTMTLVYQSYFHQSYAIDHLKKANKVICVGKNKLLYKHKIKNIITKLIKNKTNNILKNNNYIDAKGFMRIEKIISNILKNNLT